MVTSNNGLHIQIIMHMFSVISELLVAESSGRIRFIKSIEVE
jgi:hypothetical protein